MAAGYSCPCLPATFKNIKNKIWPLNNISSCALIVMQKLKNTMNIQFQYRSYFRTIRQLCLGLSEGQNKYRYCLKTSVFLLHIFPEQMYHILSSFLKNMSMQRQNRQKKHYLRYFSCSSSTCYSNVAQPVYCRGFEFQTLWKIQKTILRWQQGRLLFIVIVKSVCRHGVSHTLLKNLTIDAIA